MKIIVFASFTPKPGEEAKVQAMIQEMVVATRQEPGNLLYNFYQSAREPKTFHIFEIYADEAGLDAHRNADYYKAYRANLPEFLAEAIAVKILNDIDVV